jgi:MGT family glycosyltransferase
MGHIKPMMPLLSGLVAQGQQIACFGHKKFEGTIRSTGAGFSPYPDLDYDVDAPDFNLIAMGANLIRASETITSKLLPDVAALSPQLILQDFMALWSSRIGTSLGIPRIHTVPTLVFNAATQRRMRKEDGVVKLARDVVRGAPSLIRAMINSKFAVSVPEAFGVERSWRKLAPPVCELVFCLEELQVGNPQGDIPRHYIGPTINPSRQFGMPTKQGYALITFGTLSNNETQRFEAAIRGALSIGLSVVVQCGGKVNLLHLESVAKSLEAAHPGQTITILDSVPDMEVLIVGADIVIHHAGMATTWETVRYCKPAVFIPTITDQMVFASQLEHHGFGVRLPRGRELDAAAIASSIQAALARDYPWEKFQMLLAKAGGAPVGVEIILKALEAKI